MSTTPRRAALAIVLTLLVILSACSSSSTTTPTAPTTTTTAVDSSEAEAGSSAVESTFVSYGNADAGVVLLIVQGGPVPELEGENAIREIFRAVDFDKVHLVVVHQDQTLDPAAYAEAVDFDQAKAGAARSVAMLSAVVDHFVDQTASVHVWGSSYGAFVAADLLATQGPVADGYLISNGRLDMPSEVWERFAEGGAASFVDGTEVVEAAPADAGPDGNMARLAAGLGHKRYTELLAETDLGTVEYLYGTVDEAVGALTAGEIQLLEQQGATVTRYEGDHGYPEDLMREALGRLLGSHNLATASTTEEPAAPDESVDGDVAAADIATLDELNAAIARAQGTTEAEAQARLQSMDDQQIAAMLSELFGWTDAELADLAARLGVDDGGADQAASFEASGDQAIMTGVIGSGTPEALTELLDQNPAVTTIVLQNVPGSMDDEANIAAARILRDSGLATHVPADGVIASGGVDFFLAGTTRSWDPGAVFAVHSWATGDGTEGRDVPRDDPQHRLYLDYYAEVGIPAEFYWFTLDAAPAASVHEMADAELAEYGFAAS